MTKEELITQQQLEIEDYKQKLRENSEIVNSLRGKFYNIGAPLNDNALRFNTAQMRWCVGVVTLIDQVNKL